MTTTGPADDRDDENVRDRDGGGDVRVLQVLGTSAGGVGVHVRSVLQRFPGLGVRAEVAAPSVTLGAFDLSRWAPVHRWEIGTGPRPADVTAVRQMRRLVREVDVVHAHGLRAAALVGLAVGRRSARRTPVIATWHNAVPDGGLRGVVLGVLARVAARRADLTLGASADLVARARELGAPHAAEAPVAAPAGPGPSADPDVVRTRLRAELGLSGQLVVLAVGRLAPQKDYPVLLEAAQRWGSVAPDHGGSVAPGHRGTAGPERPATPEAAAQDPVLLVVGDGPLLETLQAQIDAGSADIRLLGRRDDVADLLTVADVYCLTSQWEARALVVQEAMRAGVPVVATAVGGIPELVGPAAVTVPAGDPGAVADAVRTLLADDAARDALGRAGRERAHSWPDEDDTTAQLADVYRRARDRR